MQRELLDSIRSSAEEVFRELGPGYLERAYHNAILVELREKGISYDTEVPVPIRYKDHIITMSRCDVVVEKTIIVELKSISKSYFTSTDQESIQLRRYLKDTNLEHGILINFPKTENHVIFYEITPN